jgi:hypothetical protein
MVLRAVVVLVSPASFAALISMNAQAIRASLVPATILLTDLAVLVHLAILVLFAT